MLYPKYHDTRQKKEEVFQAQEILNPLTISTTPRKVCKRQISQHRESRPRWLQGRSGKLPQLAAIPFAAEQAACIRNQLMENGWRDGFGINSCKDQELNSRHREASSTSYERNVHSESSSKPRAFSLGSPIHLSSVCLVFPHLGICSLLLLSLGEGVTYPPGKHLPKPSWIEVFAPCLVAIPRLPLFQNISGS